MDRQNTTHPEMRVHNSTASAQSNKNDGLQFRNLLRQLNSVRKEVQTIQKSIPRNLTLDINRENQVVEVLDEINAAFIGIQDTLQLKSYFFLPETEKESSGEPRSECVVFQDLDPAPDPVFPVDIMSRLNELENELSVWQGQMSRNPSVFTDRVGRVLKKFSSYADSEFSSETFTKDLKVLYRFWVDNFTDDTGNWRAVLTDSLPSEEDAPDYPIVFSKERVCSCDYYRAQLDEMEMNTLHELETYQDSVNVYKDKAAKLENEFERFKERNCGDDFIEKLYNEYLNRIRDDIENLIGCELPEITANLNEDLPKLWAAIRREVSGVSKKARSKLPVKKTCEFYTCTKQDLEQLTFEADAFGNSLAETQSPFKLSLGSCSFTVLVQNAIQTESEQWDKYEDLTINILPEGQIERATEKYTIPSRLSQMEINSVIEKSLAAMTVSYESELRDLQDKMQLVYEQSDARVLYSDSVENSVTIQYYKEELKNSIREAETLSFELSKTQLETKKLQKKIDSSQTEIQSLSTQLDSVRGAVNTVKAVMASFDEIKPTGIPESTSRM